jgi:hypothetical protein
MRINWNDIQAQLRQKPFIQGVRQVFIGDETDFTQAELEQIEREAEERGYVLGNDAEQFDLFVFESQGMNEDARALMLRIEALARRHQLYAPKSMPNDEAERLARILVYHLACLDHQMTGGPIVERQVLDVLSLLRHGHTMDFETQDQQFRFRIFEHHPVECLRRNDHA